MRQENISATGTVAFGCSNLLKELRVDCTGRGDLLEAIKNRPKLKETKAATAAGGSDGGGGESAGGASGSQDAGVNQYGEGEYVGM